MIVTKVWVYKRKGIKGWWVGWYESGGRKAKALPNKSLTQHYCRIKYAQLNSEVFTCSLPARSGTFIGLGNGKCVFNYAGCFRCRVTWCIREGLRSGSWPGRQSHQGHCCKPDCFQTNQSGLRSDR